MFSDLFNKGSLQPFCRVRDRKENLAPTLASFAQPHHHHHRHRAATIVIISSQKTSQNKPGTVILLEAKKRGKVCPNKLY